MPLFGYIFNQTSSAVIIYISKMNKKAGKKVQWSVALAAKADDLSWIQRSHMVTEEN